MEITLFVLYKYIVGRLPRFLFVVFCKMIDNRQRKKKQKVTASNNQVLRALYSKEKTKGERKRIFFYMSMWHMELLVVDTREGRQQLWTDKRSYLSARLLLLLKRAAPQRHTHAHTSLLFHFKK